MPLAARIQLIPMLTCTGPVGQQIFNIACHQATCYWLHQEATGNSLTGDDFVNRNALFNIGNTMTALAAFGTRVQDATALRNLANGTVLVFTDLQGGAKHSCVLDSRGLIGGYNQIGWLFGGYNHQFTTHPKTQVQWKPQSRVTLSSGQPGHLIAIGEQTALQFAQNNF